MYILKVLIVYSVGVIVQDITFDNPMSNTGHMIIHHDLYANYLYDPLL